MPSMKSLTTPVVLGLALALGACAGENMLTSPDSTASIKPAKPAVDPVCAALAAKMDSIRQDGVTERVDQASHGKTKTVSVKRESLSKMTEYTKASTEFQAKCTTYPVAVKAAATPPAKPVAAKAAEKSAASAAAKAKTKAVAAADKAAETAVAKSQ